MSRRRALFRLAALLPLVGCAAVPSAADPTAAARPAAWAEALELRGAPNLFRVDDGLLRSAQPSAQGFHALRAAGVRTVVNLRTFDSDREPCRAAGLEQVRIPLVAWDVDERDVARFLAVATDPERRPVLVHCLHGADRTGALCAAYRVVVQGWSKDEALFEMTGGGFGYHPVWTGLVELVRGLDVEALRRGLERGANDAEAGR